MTWLWLLGFGVLSGIIGGMGMGGGTILIPLLTIFAGINQIVAQGYNLLAFLPMSIIAIFFHIKNDLIKTKNLVWIITCGILFAILGAICANLVDENLVKKLFGVFLIVISIFEFFQLLKK